MTIPSQHCDSVLFVTLDSCRLDTFQQTATPNFDSLGMCHAALAPSHFTYASHAAMFVGFTPSVREPKAFLNAKFARLFRLDRAGHAGFSPPGFVVSGENIISGFRNAGHVTIGTAAMAWFDPATLPSAALISCFDKFHFACRRGVRTQMEWLASTLADETRPTFTFVNVGETHVPYHHDGAPWRFDDNPCVPFQLVDRAAECAERQSACLMYVDAALGDLLKAFKDATIIVCSDHGDCWGEDGLWEHGVSHAKTLEVPLIVRYRGTAID